MSMLSDGNTFASVRPIGVGASRRLRGALAAVLIIAGTEGSYVEQSRSAARGEGLLVGLVFSARSASDFDFDRSGER